MSYQVIPGLDDTGGPSRGDVEFYTPPDPTRSERIKEQRDRVQKRLDVYEKKAGREGLTNEEKLDIEIMSDLCVELSRQQHEIKDDMIRELGVKSHGAKFGGDVDEAVEVPVGDGYGLTRDQSVRAHIYRSGGHSDYRGLVVGDFCRAMVCGPRNDIERRALAEGTDSAGGYTVPTILSGQIIDKLRAQSVVIRAGATTVPLGSDKHDFARLDTDPTATWRAENASISDNSPTFGRVRFTPQSCVSLVKVSRELLEDSKNLNEALQGAMSKAFAAELDRVALYGSGSSNEPTGVKNVTGIGSVEMGTNGAALTSYDELVDTWYEVAVDNAPGVTAFCMHPRTRAAIAKMKGGDSQPVAKPELLKGIPFLTTTNIPIDETQGTASDASTILTGYWPHLVVGIRSDIRIEVLKERFSDNFQMGFLCHMRADVQVWHPESFAELIGIIPA